MKELYRNTWTVDDQGVRIFILCGTEKCLIVDSGMTERNLREMAAACTDLPAELLSTHADMDHVSGNDQFDEFYMHPSEAFLYHGKAKMIPVYEGDVIDLGERELEVVHLPGHTPGSITLLDRANRCLIGGDPIQKDGDIYMFGPHRNMHAYIASLERLSARTDFDDIYPSHAEEKVSRDIIPLLIQGAKDLMEGKLQGTERDAHGHKIVSYDIGVDRFLCDPA